MSTILEVKNLGISLGKQKVFSELSFALEKNNITVLRGKSGIGKTTLLKCLTLLEQPDVGSISICGQIISQGKMTTNEHIVREKVGIVFQDFYLWDNKTVLENITEALLFGKRMSAEDAYVLANRVAHKLHLYPELLNKYPPELSRGQRQRVAIARTLVMDYEIIIFDEPTASLDETFVDELVLIIKDLRESNKTILIVSHDREFAEKIGDIIFDFEDLVRA